MFAKPVTHWSGHGHVRQQAVAEEALVTREGAIDELVDDHEHARRKVLPEGSHRTYRNHVGSAEPFQRVDIGAEVDLARRNAVAASMARQKCDIQSLQFSNQYFVGWAAER